jgi:tryptophan synthase alpha chain
MSLADVLHRCKARGATAFVPYLTAGDPSLDASADLVRVLAEAGALAVEVGVPFSDPVADGPVIQRAATRAVARGVTLSGVLDTVAGLRRDGVDVPLILFTYYNPVHHLGARAFADRCREAGVTAVLCVDLPPEEADEHRRALSAAGVETVFLAAPTTAADRLVLIGRASTSVVYYVSRTGVTGERVDLSTTLAAELDRVRCAVPDRALLVGFGISTPGQGRQVAPLADAVVVGSALVRLIEEAPDPAAAVARAADFARSFVSALEGTGVPEPRR